MNRLGIVIQIRGVVQGVGFRHFVRRAASALALSGDVRNRPDGSVEIRAWGERSVLERLVAAVREGPVSAEVSEVETRYHDAPEPPPGFHIRS